MADCIACKMPKRKCECFGERPRPKLARYNDEEFGEPLPEVTKHGMVGYTKYHCRCVECKSASKAYNAKNRQKQMDYAANYYSKLKQAKSKMEIT